MRQFLQHLCRIVPANTRICDALTFGQSLPRLVVLTPFNQIAFDHYTNNTPITVTHLTTYVSAYIALTLEYLATICMTAVNHDIRSHAGFFHHRCSIIHTCCIIVSMRSAAQNQMAVLVSHCGNDG